MKITLDLLYLLLRSSVLKCCPFDILTHPGWKIVTAGFEAATIGGFADGERFVS
jgi:hypothetical protein